MCILSYLPGEVELDEAVSESLWNGGINNPDGHGWAIASGDQMVMGRSLHLDEALSGFIDAREKHPGPALFHSRWATHGSIRVGNCHPFLVGNSHKTVLAHNGILPKDAPPAKGDARSDTAILAEDILPRRWFRLDRPTVRKSMSEWAGRGNKVVILTVDSRYRQNAYLINEGQGHWDDGVWHSNHDYVWSTKWQPAASAWTLGSSVPAYSAQGYKDAVDFIDPSSCVYCEGRVNDWNICSACDACQDCLETSVDCLCYVGAGGPTIG